MTGSEKRMYLGTEKNMPVEFTDEIKNKMLDKYLDFGREPKKLKNMNVTVVSNIVEALGTISESLVKNLEGLKIPGRRDTI